MRHSGSSRLHHSGNIAAAGLYPARDNYDPAAEKGAGGYIVPADSKFDKPQRPVGELCQEAIPYFPKEMPGSPGSARGELG